MLDFFPKLLKFYKSLKINTNYIENLIAGKRKENNFEYDFFDIYQNEIFSNLLFCFNLNRENFNNRGNKLYFNDMKLYFGNIFFKRK